MILRVFPRSFFEDKPKSPPASPKNVVIEMPAPKLPKGARNITRNPDGNEIEFNISDDIELVAAFFEKSFAADGWEMKKDFHVVTKHAGLIQFDKGNSSVSIDLLNLGLGGGTEVSLAGRRLKWTE